MFFAANKANLFAIADKLPGSRVLEGRFSVDSFALGLPKGRQAGLTYARKFIEDLRPRDWSNLQLRELACEGPSRSDRGVAARTRTSISSLWLQAQTDRRLAPKKYGDRVSHDVQGSTTFNVQPAVLIQVESSAAPEAGSGVLLDGDRDMCGERGGGGK